MVVTKAVRERYTLFQTTHTLSSESLQLNVAKNKTKLKFWRRLSMRYLGLFALLAIVSFAGCGNDTEDASVSGTTVPDADAGGFAFSGENALIAFKGTKPDGSSHVGGFKDFKGTAQIDEETETVKSIAVSINVESIFSDSEKLTTHLKNVDFFAVSEFPLAEFKADDISAVEGEEGRFLVKGELSLLEKTDMVEFPATIAVADGSVTMESTFMLDRTKFGMNYGVEDNKIDPGVELTIAIGRTE